MIEIEQAFQFKYLSPRIKLVYIKESRAHVVETEPGIFRPYIGVVAMPLSVCQEPYRHRGEALRVAREFKASLIQTLEHIIEEEN